MPHYLIFGDSITFGQSDPNGGWVHLLQEHLYANDYIYNLGINSDTTEGVLSRFETELKPRLSSIESNVIIFALGVNDSTVITEEKYKANLIQLITLARKYTEQIILVSPAPIYLEKFNPADWIPEIIFKPDLVKKFSEAVKEVAEAENLKFVDLFNQLPQEYIKTLDDGVHPNTAGHRMIFDLVKTKL